MRPIRATLGLVALALGACSIGPIRDGAPPIAAPSTGDPMPRPEPRSRYGNPPSYVEMGRRYEVMETAVGYRERGIASWYGTKFHGRRTSSGEPYDMHAMTAAHKTLPLPTWVEVTNLKTRQSILVRVNDRGPFIENRIIDLSYEAARRLDIVGDGTGLVEVRALTFGEPPPSTLTVASEPTAPAPATDDADTVSSTAVTAASATLPNSEAPPVDTHEEPGALPLMYAQVGAFSDSDNAEGLRDQLRLKGFLDAEIHPGDPATQPVYRVRIGPMIRVEQYDQLTARLNQHGLTEVNLIIE